MTDPSERRESLWRLIAPPTIWGGHFLASYVTAAIWCAKVGRDASLGLARAIIAGYTVLGLAAIAVLAWQAWRRHSFGGSTSTRHLDSAGDRHRFLGFATLLLCGLSALAIVYAALVVVFVETCR